MMTGTNRGRCFACLLAVAAVVTAFLASGCLWGVVRDAQTGAPIAGAAVSFTCPCREIQLGASCGGAAMTDANGIYVIDMLPAASECRANDFVGSYMTIRKVGYVEGYYTPVFDYRDNPNASFDDLHSFWEVQDFQLVPGKWAQVELVDFDISTTSVTGEADYMIEIEVAHCHGWWDGYFTPSDPPVVEPVDPDELNCTVQAEQVDIRVTLKVNEVDTPASESDVSTAGFDWTVPDGETGWLTATLDSTDAAGPDDPDLEFTAQIRYRSLTE